MAEFKIDEIDEVNRFVVAGERLWFAADGETIVAEGDPEAASLFVSEGKRIPRADAVKLGLVKADATDKKEAASSEASSVEAVEEKPKEAPKPKAKAKAKATSAKKGSAVASS